MTAHQATADHSTAHQATAHRSSARRAHAAGRLRWAALIAAVLIAGWAAYATVRSHPATPLHAIAQGEQRLVAGEQRLVQGEHKLAHEIKIELAKEYRAIRPADADAKAPPIPPSETWPAQ